MRVADGRIVECSRRARARSVPRHPRRHGPHRARARGGVPPAPNPLALDHARRASASRTSTRSSAALKEAGPAWPYTMGWIDCLSGGRAMGRGILMKGRWAEPDEAPPGAPRPKRRPGIPFPFPSWVINPLSVRAFNALYYASHVPRVRHRVVHPESFFYPLDAIRHWNRMYGRRGLHAVPVRAARVGGRGRRPPLPRAAHRPRRRFDALRDQGLRAGGRRAPVLPPPRHLDRPRHSRCARARRRWWTRSTSS